ncbi:MAG: hypothetical protein LBQ31_01835 [Bacteroidales bacterium]|jgi:hypothetical protein|nr:hypothetical protein [Bacteroidales bacterium]
MALTRVLITVKTYPSLSAKYDEFVKTRDLYFFLGTTKQFHNVSPNPFIIIGTFYPKKETQGYLF